MSFAGVAFATDGFIAPGDPPFLILHGTKDPLVPPGQSDELAQRLAAAHVPVTLIRVCGAGHGLNGHNQQPASDHLAQTVLAFFTGTLESQR